VRTSEDGELEEEEDCEGVGEEVELELVESVVEDGSWVVESDIEGVSEGVLEDVVDVLDGGSETTTGAFVTVINCG